MNIKTLKNILYVEDEPDIQTIVQLSLESIGGFDVKTCNSGKEALEALTKYNPDLILMDVMMPDLDGPSTLKEIRKLSQFCQVPVIFMTAKAQSHEVAQYKELGVLDVVIKPFDPMTLSSVLKNIWEKHYE